MEIILTEDELTRIMDGDIIEKDVRGGSVAFCNLQNVSDAAAPKCGLIDATAERLGDGQVERWSHFRDFEAVTVSLRRHT